MNNTQDTTRSDPPKMPSLLSRIPSWMHWTVGILLLLVPAMLLPASGDMPSHLYNAWLTHQVENGLQGFTLTTQFTNVATDLLLYWLFLMGPQFAVAAVNVLAVLVFFLGGVMFIRSYAASLPWQCLVLLAMFAYGVMYWLGFTNYML